MRPYTSKWQWNLKGRPHHLIDGLMPAAKQLKGPVYQAFLQRAAMMRRSLKASLAVLILLYIGALATAIAWAARFIPAFADVATTIQDVAQGLSGFSAALLVVLLLIRRRIGQLEADLVVLCITDR